MLVRHPRMTSLVRKTKTLGRNRRRVMGSQGWVRETPPSYFIYIMSLKKKKTKALESEIERIFLVFLVLVVGVVLLIAVLVAALGKK
jgi:hypothetical protein